MYMGHNDEHAKTNNVYFGDLMTWKQLKSQFWLLRL